VQANFFVVVLLSVVAMARLADWSDVEEKKKSQTATAQLGVTHDLKRAENGYSDSYSRLHRYLTHFQRACDDRLTPPATTTRHVRLKDSAPQ
jgi:hypothetical protein